MGGPPVFSPETNTRIVLSVLAGAVSVAAGWMTSAHRMVDNASWPTTEIPKRTPRAP